jgi:hypothetical protein
VLFGFGWHFVPHVLQLSVVSSLTHCPPHAPYPSLHLMSQPVAPQMGLPFVTVGHAVMQSWQCAGSIEVSAQVPLQFVVPLGQSLAHWPSTQTWFVAQALSQPPQFAGSVLTSLHPPEHDARPWLQVKPH